MFPKFYQVTRFGSDQLIFRLEKGEKEKNGNPFQHPPVNVSSKRIKYSTMEMNNYNIIYINIFQMKTLYLNMLIPYLTHSPADKVVNHSTALSSAAARQRSSTTTHRITRPFSSSCCAFNVSLFHSLVEHHHPLLT